MKKLTALFLSVVLILLPGCGPEPEAQAGFGELFSIETVRFVTDNPQARRYVEDTLSGQRFTVTDDGALTVTVRTEPEMGIGNFAYRVESTTSVVIRGGSDHDAAKGLTAFSEAYLLCRKPCIHVGVEMTFTTYPDGGIASGIPGWLLTESSERRIALGVTYAERIYTDAYGKPHRAYILTADPQHTSIHYGTANNEHDPTPQEKQDVMQQMQSSVAAGYPVIAAVNGDFFAISGDYHPTGLAVKNGQLLTKTWVHGKPYTGVTTEGTYVMETMFLQQKPPENLFNAISGNYPLVIGGKVSPMFPDSDMATTNHPRTLAGLTEQGHLILAVIDGRQSDFSNGATFVEAAHFMLSVGAVTAINHDGGGSSTMILRNEGNYCVMNSPSDGNLRKVFGSIQLIQKEKTL